MSDWKCRDCGMTSRKEPHNTLSDHMEIAHGKRWCESTRAFETISRRVDTEGRDVTELPGLWDEADVEL
jgi:hypothetical protein